MLLSDIPPYREVAGEAALYADPHNPYDIQNKMRTMYEDASLRRKLAERGRDRLEIFQKQKTMDKLKQKLSEITNDKQNT